MSSSPGDSAPESPNRNTAQSTWNDFKGVLAEHLHRFWSLDSSRASTAQVVPDKLRKHADSVPIDTLPEKVTEHVLNSFKKTQRSAMHDWLDQVERQFRGKAATADPESPASDDWSTPIGARIRRRGIYEDDWRQRPTGERPWPVILVHGTGCTTGDWQEFAADLKEDGWAVFAAAYGTRATQPMEESAKQLAAYVDAVRTVTGADKVILVGHSQGGLLIRYWMRFEGGAPFAKHVICLSAPNHGTTSGGILSPVLTTKVAASMTRSIIEAWFGKVGFQMISGSDLLERLSEGGDCEPGVSYTCIATRFDTVLQPAETCFLTPPEGAPADTVQNLWLQDIDGLRMTLHEDMPHDKLSRALMRAALNAVRAKEFDQ